MADNYFKNKTIIILSPQPWEGLFISKHHYAMALAVANKVYFIQAPEFGRGYSLNRHEKNQTLFILKYKLLLPDWFKFHAKKVYKYFIKNRIKKILNRLINEADICVDFGCYQQYDSIEWIKAKKKIFFPVDDSVTLKPYNRGTDIIFSVSENICNKFNQAGIKCFYVNHGLAKAFEENAKASIKEPIVWERKQKIHVAYSGNINIPFIDRDIFLKLILQNPEVDFIFFGHTDYTGIDKSLKEWNELLRCTPNVKLKGILTQNQLAKEYNNIDMFLLCYKPDHKNFHGENSHKIFEYLSSGKIIVSSFISIYGDTDLFAMASKDRNSEMLSIFGDVMKSLEEMNAPALQLKRIKTALDNTYEKQLDRISQYIQLN